MTEKYILPLIFILFTIITVIASLRPLQNIICVLYNLTLKLIYKIKHKNDKHST